MKQLQSDTTKPAGRRKDNRATPPTHTNRGGNGYIVPAVKTLPDLAAADLGADYARLVCHGWDWWQEAWAWTIDDQFLNLCHAGREKSRTLADTDTTRGAIIWADKEQLEVAPHGAAGGVKFLLSNPDFHLAIASNARSYNVTVRYSAAGLWQWGLNALRHRVHDMLKHIGDPKGENEWDHRVTRVDIAFDFHSPGFTSEMRPEILYRVVLPPAAKTHAASVVIHGRGGRLQTLTLGSKAALQLQVYDKVAETAEVQGKDWMRAVWRRRSPFDLPEPIADIWRLECRFGREWLRDRNLRTHEDIMGAYDAMVAAAVVERRLVVRPEGSTDSNMSRWRIHPMWNEAWKVARHRREIIPAGPQVTMKREALLKMLKRNIAGTAISAAVLEDGTLDEDTLDQLFAEIREDIREDEHAGDTAARAQARYRYVKEPA